MSSPSRWLTWTPTPPIIEKIPKPELTKPTKPTKPTSVSFVSATSGIFQKIEQPAAKPEPVSDGPHYPAPDDLPAWAARYERIFGPGKHHRLLAYIGQRVRCPHGTGALIDAKLDRCAVDLDDVDQYGRHKVRFYKPEEIEVLQ
jgi:hypothetical protein